MDNWLKWYTRTKPSWDNATSYRTPQTLLCLASWQWSPRPPYVAHRCDETSRQIAVTVGTSAAARVVLRMEGKEPAPAAARVAAGASTDGVDEAVPADDALFHVPRGLWCYRVDRHRAVLGGALTDGGSVFEWLRSTLALAPGKDMTAVMGEVERMPPASHGLTVSTLYKCRMSR